MDIRNCRVCGKMFQYVGQPICPNCMKAMEDKLQEVKKYINEHDHVSVREVSEELGVTVKQIHRWIKEDRLMFAPGVDTGVVCTKCGMPVESGTLCKRCKESLKEALTDAYDRTKPKGVAMDTTHKDTAKMHLKRYE